MCNHTLTDEQLETIVDLTIKKITERTYQEVGKKVVGGLSWFFVAVGVVTMSLYEILKSKGIIS
jgi:hypothetical protein